ncbi:MAG: 50S ribosomal protein L29 [Spirochaetota bacterium]
MKKKLNVKDLSDSELNGQLDDTYKELREQRFQYAMTKTVENPSIFRELKRKIAMLQTVRRERELQAANQK